MPSVVDLGLGKVGMNSHPIHPSTVHLPIAFLLASSVLDFANYAATSSSVVVSTFSAIAGLFSNSPRLNDYGVIYHLSLFGYVSTIAGIVTSLPALSSGLVEGYALLSANDYDLSKPKVKTTIIHAALNDLAIAAAVYQVVSKSKSVGYMPSGGNIAISGLLLGGVAYSAYLGGGLVYEHGVGVQRQGHGKVEKEQGEKELKRDARKEL